VQLLRLYNKYVMIYTCAGAVHVQVYIPVVIINTIHQVVKLDMLLCVLMSISVFVGAQLRLGRPRSHRRQVKQWQMKPKQQPGS